jgi:hypothetical protein
VSGHTPGPWKAVFNTCGDHGTHYITSPVGVVGYWHGHKSHHADNFWRLSEQDARLIAAAPELLEALQGIIEIGKRDLSNPKYDGFFTTARAAIARATGEGNE